MGVGRENLGGGRGVNPGGRGSRPPVVPHVIGSFNHLIDLKFKTYIKDFLSDIETSDQTDLLW